LDEKPLIVSHLNDVLALTALNRNDEARELLATIDSSDDCTQLAKMWLSHLCDALGIGESNPEPSAVRTWIDKHGSEYKMNSRSILVGEPWALGFAATFWRWIHLVVLSEDIFTIPPEAIENTRVDLTIFDGKVIYQR